MITEWTRLNAEILNWLFVHAVIYYLPNIFFLISLNIVLKLLNK